MDWLAVFNCSSEGLHSERLAHGVLRDFDKVGLRPGCKRAEVSGDVGNRTRVRKIRPSNIYERSRSVFLPGASRPTKAAPRLTAGARKLLFHTFRGLGVWHSGFVTPAPTTGQRAGWADVAPLVGASCLSHSLMQRGAGQRSLCGWHLCFALS